MRYEELDLRQYTTIRDFRKINGDIPVDPHPKNTLTAGESYHLFVAVPKLNRDMADDNRAEFNGGAIGMVVVVSIALGMVMYPLAMLIGSMVVALLARVAWFIRTNRPISL